MSNELVPTQVTMTSIELVEFINATRSETEAAQLTHANFLAKVPKVLGETSHSFECDVPDSYGRPRKAFRFPKREACLMAMSYSYELQAKVFDKMTELEARIARPQADPLATLPPEQRALVALMVEQAETKKRLEITEDKVSRIEAKQQAFEEGCKYFTVVGYAVWKGLPPVSLSEAATIGKRASKLSAERGVAIDRVRDPRFGMVNSYHESILEAVIEEFLG